MLCFALLCFALLCFALPCFALLCFAWLCLALLSFTRGATERVSGGTGWSGFHGPPPYKVIRRTHPGGKLRRSSLREPATVRTHPVGKLRWSSLGEPATEETVQAGLQCPACLCTANKATQSNASSVNSVVFKHVKARRAERHRWLSCRSTCSRLQRSDSRAQSREACVGRQRRHRQQHQAATT